MKRFLTLALIFLLSASPGVIAAPKKIDVKPLQLITSVGQPTEVSGVVTSGKSIIVYGTKDSKAYARAIDTAGTEIWKLSLDQSPESIATAAAVDALGNIWIAGATPLATGLIEPAPLVTPINPDNAVLPPDIFVSDLRVVTLWKISQAGLLLSTRTLPTSYVLFPTAIAIDKGGASIVGIMATDRGNAGFLTNLDLEGMFSKVVSIGEASTTADAVVRHADGSFTIAGSSAETLSGKKLTGIVDGILVKISKELKITSVVRSSAIKAKRIWNSASSTLLLSGEVNTATKSESAVTKFSSSFVPQWSFRFASTGPTFALGSTQVAFVSTGPISGLSWNPKSATVVLITFNSKGAITAADSAMAGQREVIGLLKSRDLGVLVVTSSPELVSIFTPVSR